MDRPEVEQQVSNTFGGKKNFGNYKFTIHNEQEEENVEVKARKVNNVDLKVESSLQA